MREIIIIIETTIMYKGNTTILKLPKKAYLSTRNPQTRQRALCASKEMEEPRTTQG
jgi:hypothetical protein